AQRPKAPDELVRQIGRVRDVVKAFNVPIFEMDGYEADDILGTIVRQATADGMDTVIVTGDNDELQLVSDKAKVLLPQRGFVESALYDVASVNAKYGITPEQIPDLKGLKGDPSDNIPGVPGVGDKTAVRLIQQFGGIEGIYEHISEVTPDKLRETLIAQESQARQSKRLATIITDVPIKFDLESCRAGTYDRDAVVQLFRELEFFKVLNRLPDFGGVNGEASASEALADSKYSLLDTAAALEQALAKLAGSKSLIVRVVAERREQGRAEVLGLALGIPSDEVFYLAFGSAELDLQHALVRLRPLLADERVAKLAHDGKDAIKVLAEQGVELRLLEFDTMIAAYLLGEKAAELPALALSKLGVEIAVPERPTVKRSLFTEVNVAERAGNACAEVRAIDRLRPLLQSELEQQGLIRLFTEVEMPLVAVLAGMERNGVALDKSLFKEMSQSLGRQLTSLENQIFAFAGHRFNINSPQQLGTVLFGELKLPGARKTKSGYSTDASVLEGLKASFPIIKLILEYRQLAKLRSTYIDALPSLVDPGTGRLHTTFNQAATATGRLSSSEPNMQNIPIRGELGKQVRTAFVAAPSCVLVSADYSQIELRILAHLSQDERLLTAFREDKDIHAATASEVFGVPMTGVTPDMRRMAKVVNFGIIYGMSDYGLEQATELSRDQAAQFIAAYFQRYPGVKSYLESTKRKARERGYVETVMGRRRYIPDLDSGNRQVREAAERMAINMPVQGTAADIIKVAMVNLQKEIDRRGLKSRLILQVHDDLLLESPLEEVKEARTLLREIMSGAMRLSVPLKVDVKVGRNWGDMETDGNTADAPTPNLPRPNIQMPLL
ncbi:MAG: DNA polymerase I, partial [Dehalococcoidia bacterium]|nr:DNA polymerase I [Dehalococcoidia bacterium]